MSDGRGEVTRILRAGGDAVGRYVEFARRVRRIVPRLARYR